MSGSQGRSEAYKGGVYKRLMQGIAVDHVVGNRRIRAEAELWFMRLCFAYGMQSQNAAIQ